MSSQPELDASKGNGAKAEPDANAAQRRLLPFEPKSRKPVDNPKVADPKVADPKVAAQAKEVGKAKAKADKPAAKFAVGQPISGRSGESRGAIASGIPDEVSRRMVWRMALLCGVPSAMGMLTFVGSYLLVINDVDLPTYAVLLVSLGWFGLGVLGLSYGVLSASWDEEVVGSLVGWDEFTTNWGRMRANWRNNAELAKAAKAEADIEARRAAKRAKSGK